MRWSDCHDHQGTVVLQIILVMQMSSSLVPHALGCSRKFTPRMSTNEPSGSLEHAIRLKMITKMLREWCGEAEGKLLQAVADEKFVHIQQLGLVLMSDKDMFGDPDMVSAICPMLSVAQIEQLLINWNLNDQNMELVSEEVLRELNKHNVEVRLRLYLSLSAFGCTVL
jgi:hypothetical protein